jgi:hypothetical protein
LIDSVWLTRRWMAVRQACTPPAINVAGNHIGDVIIWRL